MNFCLITRWSTANPHERDRSWRSEKFDMFTPHLMFLLLAWSRTQGTCVMIF